MTGNDHPSSVLHKRNEPLIRKASKERRESKANTNSDKWQNKGMSEGRAVESYKEEDKESKAAGKDR